MNNWENKLTKRLTYIYGNTISQNQINSFLELVSENADRNSVPPNEQWNEKDVALITYGDSIIDNKISPLESLHDFLNTKLQGIINTVHILPFFPFSSDDGFSVIDFKAVNPELGDWGVIKKIANDFKLMADLVINHTSSKSKWFQNFLNAHGEGIDYFIEEKPNTDLSKVTRPRSTPLLSEYRTSHGVKHVWTTFSNDQIDLNFGNPDLMIAMFEIFIYYLKQGAKIIRLDAIAFLWKEIGTTCLHLPQTHEIVKLMRDVGELVSPDVIILTETNVPNKENLSYFGSSDEAHMVYQFSLPPLLLHALNSGNSQYLNNWAQSIPDLEKNCTFFNFTSSHDGIGVRPLEGLLPEEEKELLYRDIKKSGGMISMKSNTDGSTSPYELNITYYDALKRTRNGLDNFHAQRFICSQTIMLSLKGLPAFYIHSLLASPNYLKGVEQTGRARTINREKLHKKQLYSELKDEDKRGYVFNELVALINLRKKIKAFHPSAKQKTLDFGDGCFAILRFDENGNKLLSVSNITNNECEIELDNKEPLLYDLISETKLNSNIVKLNAYQTVWLSDK